MAIASPADAGLTAKALARAAEGSERAASIARAIMGLVRGGDADLGAEAAVVGESVQSALACLARPPEKDGVTLTVEIDPGLRARMRPIALQHVVLNLVLNARAAMTPGGGTLTLAARSWAAEPIAGPGAVVVRPGSTWNTGDGPAAVGPGSTPATGWIELRVIDTGAGMDAARLERVLAVGGGGGLGLSVCRRLVGEAGGWMWAVSAVGRGTTVGVVLPGATIGNTSA
jgi:signal transduction histidine kinase